MKRVCLTLAALFLLASPSAHACSCFTGDPAWEFNGAKAVFIGRVLGGTETLSVKGEGGKSYSFEAGRVRFAVEEVFKGDAPGVMTVAVPSMDDTSCGPYGLKLHEQYVVYAYAAGQGGEFLHTGVCTRTAPASSSHAKEDLAFLRNLPPPGSGGSLRGRIWANLRAARATPLPGVGVKITGPDNRVITARTDKQGDFVVEKLKPGLYKIEPELPEHYMSGRKSAEVEVADRGEAGVWFEVYVSGRVTGRVIDKEGQGFDSDSLRLVGEGKTVYGHATGQDGGFAVEGVPPGQYLLYVELQTADYKGDRKYYYPGTYERDEAAPVKLELGQTLDGLVFTLPDEFRARTVEGRALWPDGRPAAGVDVLLLCTQGSQPGGFALDLRPKETKTDADGRFRLAALAGQVYWLGARGVRKGDREGAYSTHHSPTKKIAVTDNLSDAEVVLSEQGFDVGCGK